MSGLIRDLRLNCCGNGRRSTPEFAYLPRKFKFAVLGAAEDRAAMKFHDIGLWVKTDDTGAPIFDLWVGGGQGRTPRVARLFKQDVALIDVIPLLDAMLRVYNLHGRRDNKYKARIKILVDEMGLDAYRSRSKPNSQPSIRRLLPARCRNIIVLPRTSNRPHQV